MKRSEYWNRLYNNGGNAGRPAKRKGISIFVGTAVIAVIAITAVLLTACSGAISGTGIPVEPVPTIPADSVPAAPTLGEPSAGENAVTLTWDLSSPGYTGGDGTAATITKYTLFYDEASRYDTAAAAASDFAAVYTNAQKKDIDMSNGASKVYTVVNLEPATKYYFALRTENDNGFSALSEVKEITTAAAGSGIEPAAAPGQVGNVSTVKGDGEVTVSWTAPDPGRIAGTDQTPGVITQYTVYYTADSTDKVSYLAGAKVKSVVFNTPDAENKAVTSGTISGLENFKTYYFAVTASNAFAEGPGYPDASAADVSAKPAPDDVGPGAPTDVTVLPGDSKALVNWKAPADPGVYDGEIGSITGYKVYHSDKTENLEDLTAITPTEIGNDVSAEIENLTNDTEYFFVVVAVNGTGDGSASLPVSATPTAAAKYGTVPGAPTADQATGAAESVTVIWTAPADTGQDADANPTVLSGFTVYYSTASSFTPVSAEGQKKVADNTATSVVVDGLVGETQYYFIVTASNANGESAASGTVSAVTDYSDAESVSKAAAALTGKINKLQIKGLKLTQQVAREKFEVYTGIHDTSIIWQSSDNAVVAIDSETGEWTVTRPGSDAADASITLTASITKGEASQTVETSVTVPKETAASLADLSAEEFTIELRIANPIEDGGREKIEVGVNEGVEQAATALSFGSLGLEAATDFNPAGEFKWVIVAANSVEPSDKFKIDEDGKISIVANKITPTDTAFKLRAKSTGLSYEIDTFKEVDLLLKVSIGTVSGQSPAEGSTTTDTTPTFIWETVPGAEEYELRIADSPEELAGASWVSVTGISHTPPTALTNLQTHYWQVRAKGTGEQYGPWSEGQSLKVEWGAINGQSPADGSITWDTTPELSWTEVIDAVGYEVRIADSEIGLTSASSDSVTESSYTPMSALTIGQTHYWQVRAKDGDDQYGDWSAANSLQVESDVISGQNPADGSTTTDTTPTFSWDAVPGAVEYELRIADSPAGLAIATSVRVTGTSHTPTSVLTNLETHYWQVRAKDTGEQYGIWSESQSLKVEWGTVSGQNPADSSTTTDTTPTFSWNAVPGAVEYELRIADSPAGLAIAPSVSATGTSHTPTSALTNLETHYWQVRAKDAGEQYGPWSEGQSLKVEWGAISGQSPAIGSITWDTTPELSWTEVTDAAGYEVRIADSENGLVGASSDSVTDSSYTPMSALTIGQTHYWQVRAKDGDDQYGDWSAANSLEVKSDLISGQSPADGTSTTDTTPTFSWNAVPGAVEYELRIADSPAGLASATSVRVTGTSHTPTSALTNLQTHYWQVRAKNAGGQYGTWSADQSLKVEWGAISGQSPADGSITWDTTPELSWTEVTDAVGYEVRIANSEDGLASASSDSVTAPSYTPTSTLTIGQTHYWQVRAKDGNNQFGNWSDAHNLEVESDLISGQSPADGSSSPDTTPSFSWNAVPGATGYELRIADSKGGLASASSVSVTSTTHTPTSALASGQTHYWQVRAKKGVDQYGAWSEAHSLEVESDAVSGQSPADGSSTSDTTPTFSWDAVPGAAEYELRIANSKDGLASAPSVRVTTGTTHTPTTALTNLQTYYWQVRVKKTGGQYGPWSVGQNLKVEWGTVSGQSPGDGSTTWDTTPELSWTEVTDAAGYEVRIADSASGLASASSNGVTDLSYTPLSALTIGQTHYWQVRAKDGTDQYGAWSDAYSLRVESDAVSGQSPADGSSSWDTTPTFSWDAVPGAAEYELRIADSPAGLASATSIKVTTGSTHTPVSALTIGQAHHWQVRAKNGAGQYGSWSNAQSLRVESDAVNGRSPADGSSTWDTTPTFSWDAVPGAAEYELRIADSPAGLASATSIKVTTGSTHTPVSALTIGQAHYWQVRAKDGTGQFGEWSEAHSLRVESNAVNGQNPADGSSTTDTTPTFSWDTVPGAAGYELQLADSLAGVETAQTQHVTDTSYTVSSALAKGQTHYWRVRAKDGTGQYGAWSAIVAIQIDYSIGDTGPAGEIVFYDKGSYSDGWRYLEATSLDQSTGIEWGGQGTLVEGTSTAIGSGKSNTEKIVNKLGLGNYAARLCYDLELGGFDDWFLPSKDELKELYKQKNTIGGFEISYMYYWSSFEEDYSYSWLHTFDGNIQAVSKKNSKLSVRAVRYF